MNENEFEKIDFSPWSNLNNWCTSAFSCLDRKKEKKMCRLFKLMDWWKLNNCVNGIEVNYTATWFFIKLWVNFDLTCFYFRKLPNYRILNGLIFDVNGLNQFSGVIWAREKCKKTTRDRENHDTNNGWVIFQSGSHQKSLSITSNLMFHFVYGT